MAKKKLTLTKNKKLNEIEALQICWDEAVAACKPEDATEDSFDGNYVVGSINGLRERLNSVGEFVNEQAKLLDGRLQEIEGEMNILRAERDLINDAKNTLIQVKEIIDK